VNDIPAMSRHVIVDPDPSVNSDLVEIIKEEFEKGRILFSTTAPIVNASGPHIDGFVMDSHVLSTNTCIATSANEMIANKPWSAVDRLQHYKTAYMDGSRVAISAALPLLLSVSINSKPDGPSLLILDGQPAHKREGRDKSTKIMNSGVAKISMFSMLHALRTCNVGLVLGDDAKKTLLKALEKEKNLSWVTLTDQQISLLIVNYPMLRSKYGMHDSNPIYLIIDRLTGRTSIAITCRQPSYLFAGGDQLSKMGTLEIITSMSTLFLFLKNGSQKYFGKFDSLEQSILWQAHTNEGAERITQLGHAARLLDYDTVVVSSSRMGGLYGGVNDPRVENAQARLDRLYDASEIDDDAIEAAMKKLKMAIELRNITSKLRSAGGIKGGLCGGENDPRVEKAQAVVDELLDASEIDDDAIQAAMKKLKMAIELRNITSKLKSAGGIKGGSCGGKNDHRVEKAQSVVEELLDALKYDDDAIQAAMNKLEEAIAKQQKTSEGKSAGGKKGGKYSH
jgi:hypothetical protein